MPIGGARDSQRRRAMSPNRLPPARAMRSLSRASWAHSADSRPARLARAPVSRSRPGPPARPSPRRRHGPRSKAALRVCPGQRSRGASAPRRWRLGLPSCTAHSRCASPGGRRRERSVSPAGRAPKSASPPSCLSQVGDAVAPRDEIIVDDSGRSGGDGARWSLAGDMLIAGDALFRGPHSPSSPAG